MIAKIFYPVELRIAISKLQDANDLHSEPLRSLNGQVYILFFLWALISTLMFLSFGNIMLLVSLLLLILLISLQTYLLKRTFRRKMASYIYGDIREGTVKSTYYSGANTPMKIVKICDSENSSILKIGPYPQWGSNSISVREGPREGEKVKYFWSENPIFGAVPDSPEIKQAYCLSMAVLRGDKK